MKLTRKMIPALAMLLVSVVLMSTASFAWFSMNGEVTATGMSVTATAPAALWISNQADANFTTAITLTGKAGQIEPVTDDLASNTKANAGEWVFHKLTTEGKALVNQSGQVVTGTGENTKTTLPTDAVEKGYAVADGQNNVLMQKFYLRLEGKNDGTGAADSYESKAIKANVTITAKNESADLIYQAIRVAIVAPDAVAPNTADGKTHLSQGGMVIYEFDALGTEVAGTTAFLTLVAQETAEVYVYVWFEGEDEQCRNDYSQSLDQYNVALEFVAG